MLTTKNYIDEKLHASQLSSCLYLYLYIIHPKNSPNVAPMVFARKSNQSPLRLPPVQYACSSSMIPLITTGASHTYSRIFRMLILDLKWRKVSIHITEHVPPYIVTCVHLSTNGTLSSGVSGVVQKQSIQISNIQIEENGYSVNNLIKFFIFCL